MQAPTLNFKNIVVVVSGTTKGIGQALAEAFLDANATVVALDRSTDDHLQNYAKNSTGSFQRIQIDLLKSNQKVLQSTVDRIVKEFGDINVLVNNAGISRRDDVEIFSEDDWKDVLKLNLETPFFLAQSAAKHFIPKKRGKIINLASMLSFQGGIRVPSYAASKHGVVGLTRSLAIAYGKYGINVNAIAPGFIETELTKPLREDVKRNQSIIDRIPMGRWGKPDDIKGTAIFLASPLSDYINGAVIPVDGGWLTT